MMNISFYSLFCLVILISAVNSQDCSVDPNQSSVDLIQAGTYSITNSNLQVQGYNLLQQYCYDIPLSFVPPAGKGYSVALSTIEINSQKNLNADFSIRSYKKQKSFSISFASGYNFWKSFTLSYLVTSRDDLFIGNFILNALQYTGCGNNSTDFQSKYVISNWNKPYADGQIVQAKLFLSGIRNIYNKNNSYVSLQIKSVVFNSKTGEISLKLKNSNLNSLLNIQFNYLIFSETNFKYTYETGLIQATAVLTKSIIKSSPTYLIGGLNLFSSQDTNKNTFTVLSFYQTLLPCQGSKCLRKCIDKRQCLSKLGKINLLPNRTEQCLLECGQNQVYNSKNQCQCAYGYQNRSSICQKIQLNLNCLSNEMINYTTQRCQCKPEYILFRNKCQTRCNVNGFMNGTNCQCLPGFRLYEDFCFNCTFAGQGVDTVNKKCYCVQPQYFPDPNSKEGACIKNNCTGSLRWIASKNKCGCLDDYILVSEIYCQPKCGQNYYQGGSLKCQCVSGYYFVQQKKGCYLPANCTGNNQIRTVNPAICSCKDGFVRDNQTQSCIKKCLPNQIANSNNGCDCVKDYQRDSNGACKQIVLTCPTNQIYDKNILACLCKNGYERKNTSCVIVINQTACGVNQQRLNTTNQCVCIIGFQKNNNGVCRKIVCGSNSTLVNGECVCDVGFIKTGQVCVSLCLENQIYNDKKSKCQCQDGFGKIKKVCKPCPSNSKSSGNNCECQSALVWNTDLNVCQLNCPSNSIKKLIILANNQTVYICQCNKGYYQNTAGICQKLPDPVCPTPQMVINPISCPQRSIFDTVNFKCICNYTSQYLIGGACKACESNQTWNGNSCACISGLNLINSKCLKCDLNSVYRAARCNCNYGYFDSNPKDIQNTLCKPCDITCGTCNGSSNSNCLTCSDPQATLTNGKCKSNPKACSKGYFNTTSGCKPCTQYCNQCKSQNECTQCIGGFSLQSINIVGTISSFCPQICGDGKKFQYQCDDGNLKNNDGCDQNCFVEKGWTCSSGSPKSSSVCIKGTPNRSYLVLTKPLRLLGQIAQGVTLSYVPDSLSEGGCTKCNDILLVNLISYTVLPSVDVSYLPTTKFKFLITFSFNGIYAIPDFVYSVQINPKYQKYFTVEDMAQKQVVPVSPVDLALNNPQDTLTLDQVTNPYNIF